MGYSIQICKKTIHSSDATENPIRSGSMAQTRGQMKLPNIISSEQHNISTTTGHENNYGMLQNNINGSPTTRNQPPTNRTRIMQTHHEIFDPHPNTPDKTHNKNMATKGNQMLAHHEQENIHLQSAASCQTVPRLHHRNDGGNTPIHQTTMEDTN